MNTTKTESLEGFITTLENLIKAKKKFSLSTLTTMYNVNNAAGQILKNAGIIEKTKDGLVWKSNKALSGVISDYKTEQTKLYSKYRKNTDIPVKSNEDKETLKSLYSMVEEIHKALLLS